MKAGYLSQFFSGVAAKTLSAVEADPARSHQHEFNGVNGLISVFERAAAKQVFPAKFLYLSDDDDPPVFEDGTVTWYDARHNHPTRSEHRLYFPTTNVSRCWAAGDLLVIGKRPGDSVLVVAAQGGSTIANQVRWLFGVGHAVQLGFFVREDLETEQDRIQFASSLILEQLGIVVETTEETFLDRILEKFGRRFPPTSDFSAFARTTLPDLTARDDPDRALMAWMEREEILFRTLEKHLIADRLRAGFADDVDGFLQYSLSVQNRRKSRVGLALENHLEVVFQQNRIRYTRNAATEGKARPDFLFPGGREYRDPAMDPRLLTMLGVKSTCKDRWRQVLSEAARIPGKHLLTLEAAISRDQTNQMRSNGLTLVIPRGLHETYTQGQRTELLDLGTFVALVRDKDLGLHVDSSEPRPLAPRV